MRKPQRRQTRQSGDREHSWVANVRSRRRVEWQSALPHAAPAAQRCTCSRPRSSERALSCSWLTCAGVGAAPAAAVVLLSCGSDRRQAAGGVAGMRVGRRRAGRQAGGRTAELRGRLLAERAKRWEAEASAASARDPSDRGVAAECGRLEGSRASPGDEVPPRRSLGSSASEAGRHPGSPELAHTERHRKRGLLRPRFLWRSVCASSDFEKPRFATKKVHRSFGWSPPQHCFHPNSHCFRGSFSVQQDPFG